MRIKKLSLVFFVFIFSKTIYAQLRCGNDSLRNLINDSWYKIDYGLKAQQFFDFRNNNPFLYQLKQNIDTSNNQANGFPGDSNCVNTIFVIPIMIQIYYDPLIDTPGYGTNITDQQIYEEIELLNKYFRGEFGGINTNIQFTLEITPTSTTPIYRDYNPSLANHKYITDQKAVYDNLVNSTVNLPDNIIRIAIVRDITDDNGVSNNVLGYASMPGGKEQLIIMKASWFGDASSCSNCPFDSLSRGKTLVHEMGHYLGLEHTFYQGCFQKDSCEKTGDLCCDTPPHNAVYSCNNENTCNENYNGDLNDPNFNHMSYSNENCRVEFTQDQIDLMHMVLLKNRSNLISPQNIKNYNVSGCFFSSYFTADRNFFCSTDNKLIKLLNYPTENTQKIWAIYGPKDTLIWQTSSDSISVTLGNDTGFYSVQLTIINNYHDTSIFLYKDYLFIQNCGNRVFSEKSTWHFGEYCNLEFLNNGTKFLERSNSLRPNSINTNEGTISVNNPYGGHLFHTGGWDSKPTNGDIFDKNYDKLIKQIHISGTSSQAGISFPKPYDQSKYIIISNNTYGLKEENYKKSGLRFSIFDTTLNNGNGDLVTGQIDLPIKVQNSGSYFNHYDSALHCSEMITLIPKPNNQDFWMVTLSGPDSINLVNGIIGPFSLLVYSIDSSGFQFNQKINLNYNNFFGYLKASPNGNFIAMPGYLFSFNKQLGKLEFYSFLDTNYLPYGISFSSNSDFVYCLGNTPNSQGNEIFQFNILLKKSFKVASFVSSAYSAMQLGPDNKIYIALNNRDYLGVIKKPDMQVFGDNTNECEFSENGPRIGLNGKGGICKQGLPNFIDALRYPPKDFQYSIDSCNKVKFYPVSNDSNLQWKFGDGVTEFRYAPIHKYINEGIYKVQMISGADTIQKNIIIGIQGIELIGDTLICDSNNYYTFSVYNAKFNQAFSLSVTSGNVIRETNPLEFRVKFNDTSTMTLNIIDTVTLCEKSITKKIIFGTSIQNNFIIGGGSGCFGLAPSEIIGSVPFGCRDSLQFYWEIKREDSNWIKLDSSRINIFPYSISDSSLKYRRVVYSDSTRSYSNEIEIENYQFSNLIYIDSFPCWKNQNFSVLGNDFDDTSTNYQWYYSTDSINWVELSNATLFNYSGVVNHDTFFIKRFVDIPSKGCSGYSNSIKVLSKFYNQINPFFQTTCFNYQNPEIEEFTFSSYTIDRDSFLQGDFYLKTKFYKKEWANINVPKVLVDSSWWQGTSNFTIENSNLGSGLFEIVTTCGTFWSNEIATKFCGIESSNNGYWEIEPPDEITVNRNDTFILVARPKDCGGYLPVDLTNLYWVQSIGIANNQYVKINGSEGKDTLVVIASFGDNRHYIPIYKNNCGVIYNSPQTIVYVENSQDYKLDYDLWMKDGVHDIGNEPNINLGGDYWNSPDLIVRPYDSCNTTQFFHKTPEFQVHAPNKVYVKIRNKGTKPSDLSELFVYWTLQSSLERWPIDWFNQASYNWPYTLENQANNYFYNGDSSKLFPKSGIINRNYNPIIIPKINPNDSVIICMDWYPPNPSWYYYYFNSEITLPDEVDVCLLARIQHYNLNSNNTHYGMDTAEVIETGKNVKRLNNVVTNNTKVINLNLFDLPPKLPRTFYLGGNADSIYPNKYSFNITLSDTSLFDYFDLFIYLNDTLKETLNNDFNFSGLNLEELDSSGFILVSNFASLNNLIFQPNQFGVFRIELKPKEFSMENLDKSIIFNWQQIDSNDVVVGGNTIIFNLTYSVNYKNDPNFVERPNIFTKEGEFNIKLVPNPFMLNQKIEISGLEKNIPFEIRIYNSLGIEVLKQSFQGVNNSNFDFTWNAINSGVYFVKVIQGENEKIAKSVIINH